MGAANTFVILFWFLIFSGLTYKRDDHGQRGNAV